MSRRHADFQPGFWPSHFSAADALQGLKEYGQLTAVDAHTLYWIEYQPETGGRNALCRWQNNRIECLTPDGISVRSRVHEYGGQSWCLLADQLVYVDANDQQLWLQALDSLNVTQLTDTPDCRYGAPVWDRTRNRLIAVQEIHGSDATAERVVNRLVTIDLNSGQVAVLHEGYDFYDQVALYSAQADNPQTAHPSDADRIAWVSWNHPDQPWTNTVLVSASVAECGLLNDIASYENHAALTQPRFDEGGALYVISDHDNWWQICRYLDNGEGGALEPLPGQADAEYCAAPWQLGQSSYLPHAGGWVALSHREGMGYLEQHLHGQTQRLAASYSQFRALACAGNRLFCVASSTAALAAVISVNLDDGTTELLCGGAQLLPTAEVSVPQHLRFAGAHAEACTLLYPPVNAAHVAQGPVPLVVFLHGGPTSAAYPVFNPKIQYWTQRGFAVVDLNYRGSTGYGRAYRLQLAKAWGVSDVQDVEACISCTQVQALVNPDQMFIRGGSAGGFTALAAVAASDRFCGAASLYGVTDLRALAVTTHKFESRYLDWLVGDPVADAATYIARSPVSQVRQMRTPVIFFQGMKDAVVPPEQTERMAQALQGQGVRVEVHRYADEYHGFRDPQVQQQVLELELAFYRSLIKP